MSAFSDSNPPTRQQAFDASCAHLLRTRRPSVKQIGYRKFCVYSGSGCGLAPFAPSDPETLKEWDDGGAIGDISSAFVPDYIREDLAFYDAMQEAHDRHQHLADPVWLSEWKGAMRRIAHRYLLSTHLLDADEAEA